MTWWFKFWVICGITGQEPLQTCPSLTKFWRTIVLGSAADACDLLHPCHLMICILSNLRGYWKDPRSSLGRCFPSCATLLNILKPQTGCCVPSPWHKLSPAVQKRSVLILRRRSAWVSSSGLIFHEFLGALGAVRYISHREFTLFLLDKEIAPLADEDLV